MLVRCVEEDKKHSEVCEESRDILKSVGLSLPRTQ